MKRSDMVMKIVVALAEMDVEYPNGYGYEEQAEHILMRIEDAGMLPPERIIYTDQGDNTSCWPECTWEDEDE